jgi:HAE1 family hydrophobic/amphiphilic exporter-1
VVVTLFATLILVVLTVYVFLQNFRATIVPAVTIPVSLIGTFAVMLALGFSINQLTLFGLVLVIGIVVDDAIVVVENVVRYISEGKKPQEAAIISMREVSGPVVATTLVLLAVFVPTIFIPGISGTLFKQFAVTISIATIFSSINALTLSPALCALLLKPSMKEPRGFFRLFNKTVDASTSGAATAVRAAVRKSAVGIFVFAGVVTLAVIGFGRLPTGFVPQEDEGYCMVNVQLPDGASLARTNQLLERATSTIEKIAGVEHVLTVGGYSIIDGAASPNAGMIVVVFEDWSERPDEGEHQSAIIQNMNRALGQIGEGVATGFPIPSLPGLGVSAGFTYMLQDAEGAGLPELQRMAGEVIQDANSQSGLQGVSTTFRATAPQLVVKVERDQVKQRGISLSAVYEALSVALGSAYINDYTDFGQVFRVMAQADQPFRATQGDIVRLKIRDSSGNIIPMGTVATVEEVLGPQTITRFNQKPSIKILGAPAPGFSSGQALLLMEDMSAEKLPASMSYAWTDLSYQERDINPMAMVFVFGFSVLMVYLVLSAQYESWSIPVSVVLSVPTALLGAVAGLTLRDMTNNIYTQIGIVLLIGLATKSAILIVEFAMVKHEEGASVLDAAVEAVRLRFRAVMMTAFSFILGVIPLLIASGAGAESRKVLGTTVFFGMLVATAVSLVAVPMMYYIVQSLTNRLSGRPKHYLDPAPMPLGSGDDNSPSSEGNGDKKA